MVGIAGYKCSISKKQAKHNGHICVMCNVLMQFVKNAHTVLFSYATNVTPPPARHPFRYPATGRRASGSKKALWKPVFHKPNRVFNTNAAQLTMLCKQEAVFDAFLRLCARRARMSAAGRIGPRTAAFPRPRAAHIRRAAPCTRRPRRTPHPRAAQKAPGAFAPGAGVSLWPARRLTGR